jgi:hypothetical protein
MLSITGARITAELLRDAFRAMQGSTAEPHGMTSLEQLEKSGRKLENIEIIDENIGSFLSVARKYDIDYALKLDSSADPSNWIVFFKTDGAENMNRAMTEYILKVDKQEHILKAPEQEHELSMRSAKDFPRENERRTKQEREHEKDDKDEMETEI